MNQTKETACQFPNPPHLADGAQSPNGEGRAPRCVDLDPGAFSVTDGIQVKRHTGHIPGTHLVFNPSLWNKECIRCPPVKLEYQTEKQNLNFLMFIFERESEGGRDRAQTWEGQRESETKNPKQASASELSAQSPTRASNSGAV